MHADRYQEIEVKLAVPDVPAMRATLAAAGFVEFAPRSLEQNRIYDYPDGALRQRGELIRLREYAGHRILTYKGPATVDRHKQREEIEVDVADTAILAIILGKLGLEPRFRYEKFRSEWQQPHQPGVAMLDETPIGAFLELEGPGEWIDRAALALGFTEADYLNLSYARLFADHCTKRGKTAGDMLFPPSPGV
ncbi:MAG: class IV adenylate cyclase [Acidobacteria bacterium]|nr:class IV adenylate cyclase [Acidobacteriota bacterium]